MNKNQRLILILSGIVIIIMLIIPPYGIYRQNFGNVFRGYDVFFNLHPVFQIDVTRLFLQGVGVAILAGVLFLIARDKKNDDGSN